MNNLNATSAQNRCHLKTVHPESNLWNTYVETCVDYVTEEWPDVLESASRDEFRRSYEMDLAQRVRQGGRYLMFCVERGQRVGVANLYTDCLDSAVGEPQKVQLTLNVAEFQVAHERRRQGIGRRFLRQICLFAKDLGCRSLAVEVDLDKEKSNAFWSAAMGAATVQNGRNVFRRDLSSLAPSVDFPVGGTTHASAATLLRADACLFLRDDQKVGEVGIASKPASGIAKIVKVDFAAAAGDSGLQGYFWGRMEHELRRSGIDRLEAAASLAWSPEARGFVWNDERGVWSKTLPPLQFVWIRHAEVEGIARLTMYPDDARLRVASETLEKVGNLDVVDDLPVPGVMFSSALQRARQTAEALAEARGVGLVERSELNEFFPEELVGLTAQQADRAYGEGHLRHVGAADHDQRFPESEKVEEAHHRIERIIDELTEQPLPHPERYMVSHGTLHELFVAQAVGDRPEARERGLTYLEARRYRYNARTQQFSKDLSP